MTLRPIPLVRRFMPVPLSLEAAAELQAMIRYGGKRAKCWPDLIDERLCVILADAGAGKTYEIRAQAQHLCEGGRRAFFIRIEDIADNLGEAFEIGEPEDFTNWLDGSDEAWFYLDSVDEARLANPRDFERALRRFERRIRPAKDRAHVVITSRPYAWRFNADAALIETLFGISAETWVAMEHGEGDSEPEEGFAELFDAAAAQGADEREVIETGDGLQLYWLTSLDKNDVRMFAAHRGIGDPAAMLDAIERGQLEPLIEKPFDLEGVIVQWLATGALGGRTTVLQHMVGSRLDEPDPDRRIRQPLGPEEARSAAQLLAFAVTMTGLPGIQLADQGGERNGLDAAAILGWNAVDVDALLSRGLFDDAIYGAVRFRHRDIRELLAAEYLAAKLREGAPRQAIERLFFAEQYGQPVIRPTMRPVLTWLILFDEPSRQRALALAPELAIEGGDPSRLPPAERRQLLRDIVDRIVRDVAQRSGRDNAAIARIATKDLEPEALDLIGRHRENDDAIFFLGRFAWQGGMTGCVPALLPIALDPHRGEYARIAAARSVLTLSEPAEQRGFWDAILALEAPVPWTLAADMVRWGLGDADGVDHVLRLIRRMPDRDRFAATGYEHALGDYVDRIAAASPDQGPSPLARFISELDTLLGEEPHVERGDCRVSERNSWLLNPAMQAVERLIAARSPESFDPAVAAILQKVPALRFWRDSDFTDRKSELERLVPAWPEFNDQLFWSSVAERRAVAEAKDEQVADAWSVLWIGSFARFSADDFGRVLDWVGGRDHPHDNLVALSLAFRIYAGENRPAAMLEALRDASARHDMSDQLDNWLSPPENAVSKRIAAEDRRWKRERAHEEKKRAKDRAAWMSSMRADPDRVRNPPIAAGEISNDQYWLMRALHGKGGGINRDQGVDWRALIPEFGEEVAKAYRDAARRHWRQYRAPLGSEGASTSSVPYALLFAMAGLGIEAQDSPDFANGISDAEMEGALRFIHWELNGFPAWLPDLSAARPDAVITHIWGEARWELEVSVADQPRHYILHDIAYYGPWLHAAMAPLLLDWLAHGRIQNHDALRYVLQILKGGSVDAEALAVLAHREAERLDQPFPAEWFALWIDSGPAAAIPAFDAYLTGRPDAEAAGLAQQMIIALAGDGRGRGLTIGAYQTAPHLLALYRLMHRFVRPEDDIDRRSGGAYSPTPRDSAQDARDRLFGRICDLPGKDSYIALRDLAAGEPDPDRRSWIEAKAVERATLDADHGPWTPEQVRDFARSAEITPKSHRQLYDLGLARLIDYKAWLEEGNDSPARTYQRVAGETEMRNLVTGWLNREAHGRYVCAQEAELANAQRPDIWLQSDAVAAPVPIELKLVDMDWTGPVLCERLRNQLAGGYLRDARAGCGIFLLIWKGEEPGRRWHVDGERVDFAGLPDALRRHWNVMAGDFPGVEAIEVVGIDLARRARR